MAPYKSHIATPSLNSRSTKIEWTLTGAGWRRKVEIGGEQRRRRHFRYYLELPYFISPHFMPRATPAASRHLFNARWKQAKASIINNESTVVQ